MSPQAIGSDAEVIDRFGRIINGYGVDLVDWQAISPTPSLI
ncbi:hypothetical protein ACFQ5D_04540 [Paenibacillus farraposensis]|uniref:Uncharacterized protein n=1 Tax=Paenibacillus farraposensis TaxID=2807095 RepID=A0ABW4DAE9_9BACL|nr:hypothetical protein [Paenibacillus farraposensis]